jgi:hypothetical protein
LRFGLLQLLDSKIQTFITVKQKRHTKKN